MFKAYNGLRRPLANTKWLCIDTWSNSSCQVAAFLKTHGWHTFFLHRNWFTDWRLLAPEKQWSFDIIWSFWNEIKASPISLCVGLGASSCNLASYAGALTSTTNQTPQTPGPLVQAPLVESLTTHLNTDSRNSTHPQHSSRFSSKTQVSQFQVTVGSYPTLCCPKLRH